MNSRVFLLILALGLCALITHDMTKAIRTGETRTRTGTIRRATRPDAFRFYLICAVLTLAVCFGIAIWAVVGNG
jgi:hypothetical protein